MDFARPPADMGAGVQKTFYPQIMDAGTFRMWRYGIINEYSVVKKYKMDLFYLLHEQIWDFWYDFSSSFHRLSLLTASAVYNCKNVAGTNSGSYNYGIGSFLKINLKTVLQPMVGGRCIPLIGPLCFGNRRPYCNGNRDGRPYRKPHGCSTKI